MPELLKNIWRKQFGNLPPVGYLLKEKYPNRWVRFHSLPDGERYPESDEEWRTVLHRHNTVLNHLIGTNEIVNVISTEVSRNPQPSKQPPATHGSIESAYWQSIANVEWDDDSEEDLRWHLFLSTIRWGDGVLDDSLKKIAKWEDINLLICHRTFNWVYSPYDGGADVIASDTELRDLLRDRFSEWWPHESGGY